MRKLIVLAALWLFAVSAAGAQIRGDQPDQEEIGGLPMNPLRAGRLEVTPIVSVQYHGGGVAVNVGASFGILIHPAHQLGGTFIYGNTVRQSEAVRTRSRALQREIEAVIGTTPSGLMASVSNPAGIGIPSVQGWGASMTGFYRYNLPVEQRKVRPFLQVFGGKDFRNGFDYTEVGGAVGARRIISSRAALTAQYGYSLLFLDGKTHRRSVASVGVSAFVGR